MFYNTLKHNCIILYHIWYLQHDKPPFYIYSRILPVLISACRNKFRYYKTCIYSITVFYNTLKHNRIILYHIWYLLHDEPTVYIYILVYSQYWFQHAVINLITTTREFTPFQHSKTLSSIISSFCIIFDICSMMNHRFIYIPEYSQYWFQHAVINLITTRREFTLLQYSTTLSSIIASFCIIFDICNMINHRFIYILVYSQYWFQHAALNLITKSSEFTLLQYSTTLSSIIASFCIIFDICNMINYRCIYIPEYSQYWYQHAVINLVTTRGVFTLLQYSTTLSSIIASFCIIFDICYMMNQQYIYIPEHSQYCFSTLHWI